MKQRIEKAALMVIAALLIGIGYLIFCRLTGLAIPCIFHKITGYKCPGCGITTLCIEFSRGNFQAAFEANPVVTIFLLPYGILFLRMLIRYIRGEDTKPKKLQTIFYYFTVVVLVCFGIIRNI